MYLDEQNGLLCIRRFPHTGGGAYLGLHGELCGVVLVGHERHCNYWSMGNWDDFTCYEPEADWTTPLKRIECNGPHTVQHIPLDTFTVMQLECLSSILE